MHELLELPLATAGRASKQLQEYLTGQECLAHCRVSIVRSDAKSVTEVIEAVVRLGVAGRLLEQSRLLEAEAALTGEPEHP